MNAIEKKDPKLAQIGLAKLYEENIAIELPLSWKWDKRDIDSLPYIFGFSVAVTSLDCRVGDLVMDFGCGSGWASEWLNRLGYRVVSIDISEVLLNFAKKRLSCDSRVNLNDLPAYQVACDCEILPFKDETFDGVICLNTLHHMPDYQKVLDEMFRVLKKDGRAAFSEPGGEHSHDVVALKEIEDSGVLEKDVILSDIYEKALKSGFKELTIKPIIQPHGIDFTYLKWQSFLNGMPDVIEEYSQNVRNVVEKCNPMFTLHKGLAKKQKDSRFPGVLKAQIEVLESPAKFFVDKQAVLKVRITNTGDTIWLAGARKFGGSVVLGLKLSGEGMKEKEWEGWESLPQDVWPGKSVNMDVHFKAPDHPGRYILKIDLVVERMTWFEHVGSKPITVEIVVQER